MLPLLLLVILLTQHSPAFLTDAPTFAERLDKLLEKLDTLTVAPQAQIQDKLYAKLEKLNSLTPDSDKELTDEDEELLSAMQLWGMLSPEQMERVVKELQSVKVERSEKLAEGEYGDGEWVDEELQDIGEGDYPMDANEDWDDIEPESALGKPAAVTPSAFTRQDQPTFSREVLSAVDPIAATNERPRILDDSMLTPHERAALRRAALAHISTVLLSSKCLTPQPRWLTVRQLAPAADTVYMPPCVLLHRCAPDSGCCSSEGEVCAPVDGKYVTIPFYLNKADGNLTQARMLFFNHTKCACVSRDTLQSTARVPQTRVEARHSVTTIRKAREGLGDWRPTEEPRLERDEEPTAPPQLRRCTCPGLFLAKMGENGVCTCVCEWPDLSKRRDCLSLARGREHFGLRDRVCVAHGDCNPPSCEYGAYERNSGRCPLRKFRRIRYHRGRIEKTVV